MDELDEFNEAPHIVHGDVHINHDDHLRNGTDNHRLSAELLEDEDEDVVLSTDDLLRGGTASHNLNSDPLPNAQRGQNGDLGGASSNIADPRADWYVNT